ncbi:hypothetical protein BZM27_05920 [Paraburkholderia steynii]|uniref:NinG protein n=1 Tax=Paraburkholderia steynii TaxID=1245441 RepID=A0A4R0XP64_9BURK|nr:hypothetical protein BZM27_05920 [Paraburkholderia steynii]
MNRLPRKKKCAACKTVFEPARSLQKVCSPKCAADFAAKQKAQKLARANREERKSLAERKAKLKTRREWIAEAQAAFNAYVRERDYGKPCISCGIPPREAFGGAVDCGHYRSVGSASQHRFNLKNCAAQCVKCNRYLGSNAVEMRKGLIIKIGLEELENLESDQTIKKFNIEYLARIKRVFLKKARRAKARRNHEHNEMEYAAG